MIRRYRRTVVKNYCKPELQYYKFILMSTGFIHLRPNGLLQCAYTMNWNTFIWFSPCKTTLLSTKIKAQLSSNFIKHCRMFVTPKVMSINLLLDKETKVFVAWKGHYSYSYSLYVPQKGNMSKTWYCRYY